MKYGDRLKKARSHVDLTQAGLAYAIGNACSQENISKLERGNATGSEFTLLFAKACGINPFWLATGEGEMLSGDGTTGISRQDLDFINRVNDLPAECRKTLEAVLVNQERLLAGALKASKQKPDAYPDMPMTHIEGLAESARIQFRESHEKPLTGGTHNRMILNDKKRNDKR